MGKIQISYVEQKFNWGEFRDLGRKTQELETEDGRRKTLGSAGVHVVSYFRKRVWRHAVQEFASSSLVFLHFFGILISTAFPVRVRRKSSSRSACLR